MSTAIMIIPYLLGLGFAITGGVMLASPVRNLLRGTSRAAVPADLGWELAPVLLVASILCAGSLFPGAAMELQSTLRTVLAVAVGLMAMRLVLVMLFAMGWLGTSTMGWALTVLSLSASAVLVQVITIILGGTTNLVLHAGVAFALGVLAISFSLALWAGYYYQPGRATREIARGSYWYGLFAMLVLLPLALFMDEGIMDGRNLFMSAWPLVVAPILGVIALMQPWRRRYFVATAIQIAGVMSAVMVLMDGYVIRPTIVAANVLATPVAQVSVAGTCAVFAALVLGWWLGARMPWSRGR